MRADCAARRTPRLELAALSVEHCQETGRVAQTKVEKSLMQCRSQGYRMQCCSHERTGVGDGLLILVSYSMRNGPIHLPSERSPIDSTSMEQAMFRRVASNLLECGSHALRSGLARHCCPTWPTKDKATQSGIHSGDDLDHRSQCYQILSVGIDMLIFYVCESVSQQ